MGGRGGVGLRGGGEEERFFSSYFVLGAMVWGVWFGSNGGKSTVTQNTVLTPTKSPAACLLSLFNVTQLNWVAC